MSGGSPHRPRILPAAGEGPRPRWSVMIPTYNCAPELRGSLGSVLAQDAGPDAMQIEVIDDHSTADDPGAVVQALGRGRVGFHRQPQNLGHVGNFNACIARARGELVHILHGDDAVEPGFYIRMQDLFARHPDIGAAYCRYRVVNEQGRTQYVPDPDQPHAGPMPDALDRIAAHQPIQTPAMVVRRHVYEQLGGFDSRMLACGEDWEMWVRIAANFPIGYEPEVLAVYRTHTESLTGRSLRSGQNIRDLRTAVAIYGAYLPPALASRGDAALDKAARWALTLARRLGAKGELAAASVQLREALRTASTWRTRAAAVRTAGWLARQRLRQASRRRGASR